MSKFYFVAGRSVQTAWQAFVFYPHGTQQFAPYLAGTFTLTVFAGYDADLLTAQSASCAHSAG